MLDLIAVNTTKEVTACVIWLHGLGADGHDFESLVEMLNLPNIRFVLPHAPYKKITMNNGYEMRAWYDLYGLASGTPQDAAGIQATQLEIHHLISEAIDSGVPANRIALAGFSQGGAMALHTVLRYPETLAGVIALSTYLPLQQALATEKHQANHSIPIFMAHGDADEVINLETAQLSHQVLIDAGYEVEWHTYPMAHSVHAHEIEDIRQFLIQILP